MRKEEVRDLSVVTHLRTSHAKVVEQLGLAIVGGDFDIGETLPGDVDLEQRFDVSRSVLREAMKTLAAKGLVIAKSRVGTRVTERCHWDMLDEDVLRWHFESGVTREFIDQLYDIRLVLEPATAAFAAASATAEDCAELRGYAMLLGSPDLSWRDQAVADLRFHIYLTLVGGNLFMDSMVGFIKAALDGAFTLTYQQTGGGPRGDGIVNAHLAIVAAIEQGDQNGARIAMETVIQRGRAAALAAIEGSSRPG
ncbi:DNA-binding FadR family transcriptional regulator [Peteryoungia aggregata LMG 23059]|uniref:DNA-binding FadR family transcriptional regulator n=1 Tax=Peteryoungia aggregata LMG 23059 TaxID=1368425 RepID=A0ABU0GCF9_9HYPH|nr:FCD domain-containing protein [Peteryoungia aggregata]MDQ0423030.1 DNA-binding FadR family transcriptional regulator [Peteryoungia aggregata LMG 23059]